MEKKYYPNPFELYAYIINHNVMVLNKFIQMNMRFFELTIKRISFFQTTSMDKDNATKKVLIKELVELTPESEPIKEPQPNIDKLEFDAYHAKSTMKKTAEQAMEDINLELINNKPISAVTFLDSEQIMKLNLFGIHTIKDLNESNLNHISKKTGIPRSNLIF
jgi:hypothetical protein